MDDLECIVVAMPKVDAMTIALLAEKHDCTLVEMTRALTYLGLENATENTKQTSRKTRKKTKQKRKTRQV